MRALCLGPVEICRSPLCGRAVCSHGFPQLCALLDSLGVISSILRGLEYVCCRARFLSRFSVLHGGPVANVHADKILRELPSHLLVLASSKQKQALKRALSVPQMNLRDSY